MIQKHAIGTVSLMTGLHSVPTPFLTSMIDLVQYNAEYVSDISKGEFIHYDAVGLSYHETARNEACKRFLGNWLLQLDTDHSFEPDLLSRLLNIMVKYDLPVLASSYFRKGPPYLPIVSKWNEAEGRLMLDVDAEGRLKWSKGQELYPIDAAGGGGLLIKRNVIDRIYNELNEEPFTITPPWSEDYSFYMRCRKLNIPCHLSPRIECNHLTWREIGEDDHRKEMIKLGVKYD